MRWGWIAVGLWGSSAAWAQVYRWDDGSGELPVGLLSNEGAFAINAFRVSPLGDEISAIAVAFGDAPLGERVSLHLWLDPNNDGHPRDAKLLRSVRTFVRWPMSNRFSLINIDPVELAPNQIFFVGIFANPEREIRPFYLDLSPSRRQSWVSFGDEAEQLNGSLTFRMDDLGLAGNWLIRAFGRVRPYGWDEGLDPQEAIRW